MFTLDLIQTLAFAGVVLFIGHGIRRVVTPLATYNIPAPVIGGLLIALLVLAGQVRGIRLFTFDTTLQTPLMIAFFTTIGYGASYRLLRSGGPLVAAFLAASTVMAVLQNVIGIALARALGQHALLGVIAGSVTLAGGPATGLAFAPLFEQAGVPGAATIAVAAAMVGIVTAGLVGSPVATALIERLHLATPHGTGTHAHHVDASKVVERELDSPRAIRPSRDDSGAYTLLKSVVLILVAMWAGGRLSAWFTSVGITLPAYIGAMLAAAIIRNVDDATGWLGLSQRTLDHVGIVALSLFLVLALMTLELLRLVGLAIPLAIILSVQVVAVVAAVWVIFRLMGRDYEAAVISAGFCGFMLGTTANSMANMDALAEKYGPAPTAFLVVPIVGAFLIDFTNALIITAFLNVMR